MPMNKPHLEFLRVDLAEGWATPPGYPAGIKQKILASDIDETRKMGSRTRLLRFDPGVYTTVPFVHEYWEEVFLVSGDLVCGSDAQGKGGESFTLEISDYAGAPTRPFTWEEVEALVMTMGRPNSEASEMCGRWASERNSEAIAT